MILFFLLIPFSPLQIRSLFFSSSSSFNSQLFFTHGTSSTRLGSAPKLILLVGTRTRVSVNTSSMRVHPAPAPRKRLVAPAAGRKKRLRRLPHVFSKVIELPLPADTDVTITELPTGFRFVSDAVNHNSVSSGAVRTRVVRIHPGVIKAVVVVGDGGEDVGSLDGLEIDRWRFRLPPAARASLTSASFSDGKLVVTVPKAENSDDEDENEFAEEINGGDGGGRKDGGGGGRDLIGGGIERVVEVQ